MIRTTDYHQFWSETKQGWVQAYTLSIGDRLQGIDGESIEVIDTERNPGIHRVYNLTVETDHIYRVGLGNTLVHNNDCKPGGSGSNRGTIYRVPREATPSGKPYIGRHNKSTPQKTRKSRDGRDRSQAEVIDEYDADNLLEGRIKEEQAILEVGLENLDNKRHEISPKKWPPNVLE